LDVIVTETKDGEWALTDLLGRSMGVIVRGPSDEFIVQPDGHATETMREMKHGPFPSLDAALAEIETHTRGVCRRAPSASL
jgi:hypothetical protein